MKGATLALSGTTFLFAAGLWPAGATAAMIHLKADLASAFPCLQDAIPLAVQYLESQASAAFFQTNYTDPDSPSSTSSFDITNDMLFQEGPNIVVDDLPCGTYGVYYGFDGNGHVVSSERNVIHIARWLIDEACNGCENDPPERVMQVLAITIGHETAHWVDWRDDFHNNNGTRAGHAALSEDGNAWEIAVFGSVETLTPCCPEPGGVTLFALGCAPLAVMGWKRRRRQTPSPVRSA